MQWRLLAFLTAGLLGPAGAFAQGTVKEEMKKLEGAWTVVHVERAGEKLAEEKTKALNFQVVFRGSKMTYRTGEQAREATYHITPDRKPAEIDTTDRLNNVEKGIYLLDGDMLKICTAMSDGQRPTEFATRAGIDHVLIVLRRAKP